MTVEPTKGERMVYLAPRDMRELTSFYAGETKEGLDIIRAYVDGTLKTEMEWADARGQGQAYVFTESATRQDVTDVDSMVDGGRMGLISVIRWEINNKRAPK